MLEEWTAEIAKTYKSMRNRSHVKAKSISVWQATVTYRREKYDSASSSALEFRTGRWMCDKAHIRTVPAKHRMHEGATSSYCWKVSM